MTYKTPEERAAYARAWRAANPERAREIDAKKRAKQAPHAATERMRKWRAANPDRAKRSARVQWEKWITVNKEKRREYERQYRETHRDDIKERSRLWARKSRIANPQRERARSLKRLYDITLEDYTMMLAAQNGRCAICLRTPDQEHHRVLHVDHDHQTGKVRGLLCSRCNTGIGLLNGQFDHVADYLAKSYT